MLQSDDQASRSRRERWWRSAFLVLATVYVGLLLVGLLAQVLGGFTQIVLILFMAWLLAFVLSPVVAWVTERTKLPRGVVIGVVYAATLLAAAFVLFYAASAIGATMGEMTEEYPVTRVRIEDTLQGWGDAVAFGRFNPNLVELYRDVEATLVRTSQSVTGDVPAVTVAVLGSLVLVIILSLYMLADSERILAKFERVVPTRYASEFEILVRTVSRAFGGFLRAQVILAAIQTVLTVAVIVTLGLPYGFLIGATSAIAMLVPFFGPPLALVPPLVAVAIFSPGAFLIVAPLLLLVQTLLVNYVQPRLMREALGMHPILVLVGLVVGAQVAGLWGALFGIPVLAVANVFFNYFVNLRAIEETPVSDPEVVLEEVRQEMPDATPEQVVALAADRVEDANAPPPETEPLLHESPATELRTAAGDLRAAAGEQRSAAGEIGDSAADLRQAVERLRESRADEH